MDSSTCSHDSNTPAGSNPATRAVRAVVHERENSRDELEALFNPNKWSQSKVPFSRRNLPSSFFNPPPTGTKTPNSRSNSQAASLSSSASHSRQNSVDELNLSQQSMRQHQQNLILSQKLKSLAQLQSNNHSRSCSEPVNMVPGSPFHRQQQRLLQPISTNKPGELGQPAANYHQTLNNGSGHLSPQIFRQQPQQPQPINPPDPQQFPPGWRAAQTSDGRPYYVNCITNETSWHLPKQPTTQIPVQQTQLFNQPQSTPVQTRDESIDLNDPKKVEQLLEQISMPQGWERTQTKNGQYYFINHNTKTTCWEDPRMSLLPNYIKTLKMSQQQQQRPLFGTDGLNQANGSMIYQPNQPNVQQPFQNFEQLKSSLMEIVQKRMELIKALEEINKQEAYLRNQINIAMGDSSASSPADSSWHSSNSSTFSSHSMPSLSNTPTINSQSAMHSISSDGYNQQYPLVDTSMNNVQHTMMHRREQSIELEHVSNLYNKMLINNTGYNPTMDSLTQQANSFETLGVGAPIDPLQESKHHLNKPDPACLLLSSDLDTDSISDDYSLSSSSTASLININL